MKFPQLLLISTALFCTLPAAAQNAVSRDSTSPLPGVDRLYALEGDNSLLAYATSAGYANLRDLVKHLDGDLDIVQIDVSFVEITPASLKALEITTEDPGKMIAAFQNGRFSVTDHVRLTTREDTVIETRLRSSSRSVVSLPLVLVPREQDDGTLTVEMLQPIARPEIFNSGNMRLIRLPDQPDGTVRLLFLVPRVLTPSQSSPR